MHVCFEISTLQIMIQLMWTNFAIGTERGGGIGIGKGIFIEFTLIFEKDFLVFQGAKIAKLVCLSKRRDMSNID